MTNGALSGLKALDLTDEKGYLCGQILAALGADVIKVEPPGGDSGRLTPPFVHDKPGANRSLNWLAYNTGKRSLTLDLSKKNDIDVFKRLASRSDFVIESFQPGYLDALGIGYKALSKINPGIIMTSITPFGQKGPYSSYKGSDLIIQAMAGTLNEQGDSDRPPVRVSVPQGYVLASAEAAEGTMIAYHYKSETGKGQHVDACAIDALAWMVAVQLPFVLETGKLTTRIGNITRLGAGIPAPCIWECKDGFITYIILGGQVGARTNLHLAQWMEEENAAIDYMKGRVWEEWDRAKASKAEIDALVEAISIFFKAHTKDELQIAAFKRDIQLYKVSEIPDLLESEQLKNREFWYKVEDEIVGESITYPGAFGKLSLTPLVQLPRAPSIGENNKEIKNELEGYPEPTEMCLPSGQFPKEALSGLKVLACVTAGVGPMLAGNLATHGATVVTIESEKYPDVTRTMGLCKDNKPGANRAWVYAFTNPNKYNISINLKNPNCEALKKRLVSWADVIVDNFRPGVMDKWGLSYNDIKQINPRAVVVSSSQQGQTGPFRTFAGAGPHLVGYSGITALSGWADRPPISIGPYPDFIAPRFANAAIMAALEVAKKTGQGQFIDVAQLEATIHFISPAILDFTINNRVQARNGNRSACAAPHAVYQCKGDDKWCAIAVFSEEEWKSLCIALGNPSWTRDKKFKDMSARKQHEDELNILVEKWTVTRDAEEIMKTLQKAGVEAGWVRNIADIYDKCPNFKSRHYWWEVDHPEMGKIKVPGAVSYLLSETPYRITRPAPCLGEHTFFVCSSILGMSDEEIIGFDKDGVLK
jgi:crotonobetainyl-CoA:carnitine CoA-transferase CaiB-like acyl-CoA transferase